MTQVIQHTSAGERGRLFSRRTSADVRESDTGLEPDVEAGASTRAAAAPHPLLLEQLGPAYTAAPDGSLTWHNDAFMLLARAAWGAPEHEHALVAAPHALRHTLETLAATGHFEPERVTVALGGITRIFRGRHFVSADPQAPGFFGYFEDITRRIAAEHRYAALDDKLSDVIRSTSDWVWETDPDLRLTEVSARIAAITGAPPDAHLGKHVLSLGEPPKPAPGVPDLHQTMTERRPFRNRLFTMRDETGQKRRIHLSGVPFFDPASGRFLGYRGTGTDVTRALEAERQAVAARQKLEQALSALETRNEQLRDTLVKAQAASDAKSDFLALTSHELRTPLNAIIGFAELCRRQVAGPVTERMAGYLDNILSASNHLVQIIDNLLDTVRIENDTLDLDLQKIDVTTLVRETLAMVEVRAKESNLVLFPPPLDRDLAIMADQTAARQILINLLTNAIKFTPEGGSVGVEVVTGKEDLLCITVWDTGIGIPFEHQQAVFDRFHRVRSNAFTTNTEGVGIGLHVARNLAQMMGGDITLDSETGRGSRFTLALPLWERTGKDI